MSSIRGEILRNSLIGEKCEGELSAIKRVESYILKWFGHVEKMVKRLYRVNAEGN